MNILITDDEETTIRGIRKMVKWEQIGVTKVMEASSGEEALITCKTSKVDIVISDIRMTGMSGIEMAKNIREQYPLCQIIFMTGYVENVYLKEAIDLEVVSFLEKPIHIKEMEEAIQKAAKKLQVMQLHAQVGKQMSVERRQYIIHKLAKELIEPVANRKAIQDDMKHLKLAWEQKEYACVAIFDIKSDENRNSEKVMYALDRIFSEIEHVYFMKDSSHIVFIIAYQKQEEDILREIIRRSRDFVNANTTVSICGVFGRCVTNIYSIYKSYETAVIYLQKFFYLGYQQVLCYAKEEERKLEFDEMHMKAFAESLKELNHKKTMECIKQIYIILRPQHTVLVSCMKGIYLRLLNYVYEEAEHAFSMGNISENERRGVLLEKIHSMDTLAECNEFLQEQVEEYYQNAESLVVNNKIIVQIMEFINQKYQDYELSVSEISDHVYLTPNYMMMLFKKRMGKTVLQYLTEVRMEAAKELLKDGRIKLTEVAIKVGFRDSNYFSKVFHKYVGVSPRIYREKNFF
ncbi:response regulator [Anaerosporobacter sp.]|uniref:response regulator n=1 Tax=Anaerosporobacter sp. TaxID=1872529 RepID=UPI00286F7EC0|nr:response regulator [Anaerosporobacter sp.]